MSRSFGRRSRGSLPPAPDGSIYARALGIPGVTALRSRSERVTVGETTVLVDYIDALYDPDGPLLPPEIGAGARVLRTVMHDLRLPRLGGRARVLHLHGPLFAVPRDGGSYDYVAPRPTCFGLESGLHEALPAEIIADLAPFGVSALQRRTFATRDAIIEIAEAHEAAQGPAMRADGFAPSCIAIDTVFLSKAIGDKRKALHVTAADPLRSIYCTLALIEFKKNEQAPVIARLAEVLGALPHPGAVLATSTDDGIEQGMVAAAVAAAKAECPSLAPLPVLDPFHVIGNFVKVLSQRRIAWQKKLAKQKNEKARAAAKLMKELACVIEKMSWSSIERCAT